MSAIGVAIPIPFNRNLVSIPSSVKNSLVFWMDRIIEDAEYPNKVGDQDRVAVGGEVFPGRANAFDGATQYATNADSSGLRNSRTFRCADTIPLSRPCSGQSYRDRR